jgi:hypothetical protein
MLYNSCTQHVLCKCHVDVFWYLLLCLYIVFEGHRGNHLFAVNCYLQYVHLWYYCERTIVDINLLIKYKIYCPSGHFPPGIIICLTNSGPNHVWTEHKIAICLCRLIFHIKYVWKDRSSSFSKVANIHIMKSVSPRFIVNYVIIPAAF